MYLEVAATARARSESAALTAHYPDFFFKTDSEAFPLRIAYPVKWGKP